MCLPLFHVVPLLRFSFPVFFSTYLYLYLFVFLFYRLEFGVCFCLRGLKFVSIFLFSLFFRPFFFFFNYLNPGMCDGRSERGRRGGHHDVHDRNGPAVRQGYFGAVQRPGVVFRQKTDGSFHLVRKDPEACVLRECVYPRA